MNDVRPKACFAGTRLEALQALLRYTTVTSIVTVPDSWVHRYCVAENVPVILTKKKEKSVIFKTLANQNVDLLLSAGFPFILPNFVLESGPLFINAHPSLLPAYKGAQAIKPAFENGEDYMGATVHKMVVAVDAGEIVAQERVWVKGLKLQEIYDLLFGVVEPMVITRALEQLFNPDA